MTKSNRFKIFVSVFIVLLIGLVSGYYTYFVNGRIVDEDLVLGVQSLEEEIEEEESFSNVPYIDSLMPLVGYEGEMYEYLVRVINTSGEEVFLEYVEGPTWLQIEGMVLRGVPPFGSSGSYKIVLRVSDGYNSSFEDGYILIEESEYEDFE